MCVVIDLDIVCLICLQPNKDMRSIFIYDGDDSELQVAQKISILSDLKVDQRNQTLPSKICNKCLQDLKAAWRFRKNCQAAVTIFQTIVKLDDVHPEPLTRDKLGDTKIKVPHGLQIKRINIVNEDEERKKTGDSLTIKKTESVDELITNTERMESSYEDLESHENAGNEDNQGFLTIHEADDNDEEHNEEFENDDDGTIVEYYITEEGATDETTIKLDSKLPATLELTEKEEGVNTEYIEEKQTKPTAHGGCSNKYSPRSRPKIQNMLNKGVAKTTEYLKITKERFINNISSSEDSTQPEVRQVKARKRKSTSPETKTPKICEICGNSYRFQHALNSHMRRHYNDKPFPCECCDKAFVSNVELTRHMRVHTGQKPYACQYCERRFSDFGSRIKHERTHTGERPYHCITCGKSFAYPHVLSVHLRTHTGEKRFRCEYCTKGFTKKAYLISHVNQHHSNLNNTQVDNNETISKNEDDLKSEIFEECIYTTEFINEESIDEGQEYDENTNQGPGKIIITHSLIQPKMELTSET